MDSIINKEIKGSINSEHSKNNKTNINLINKIDNNSTNIKTKDNLSNIKVNIDLKNIII